LTLACAMADELLAACQDFQHLAEMQFTRDQAGKNV